MLPDDVDLRIGQLVAERVPDGATIQTGIGAVPSMVAGLLAAGGGGDYGIHSEMFTTGLMALHRSGKVTNAHKGQYEGFSITTFASRSSSSRPVATARHPTQEPASCRMSPSERPRISAPRLRQPQD